MSAIHLCRFYRNDDIKLLPTTCRAERPDYDKEWIYLPGSRKENKPTKSALEPVKALGVIPQQKNVETMSHLKDDVKPRYSAGCSSCR